MSGHKTRNQNGSSYDRRSTQVIYSLIAYENTSSVKYYAWHPWFKDELEWVIYLRSLVRRGKEQGEMLGVKKSQFSPRMCIFVTFEDFI